MPNFWFPPGDTTRNQQIHHKLLCGKSKICSGHQVRSQGALRSWSVHVLGRVEHLVLWGSLEHRVGGGGWVSPTGRHSASLLASRSFPPWHVLPHRSDLHVRTGQSVCSCLCPGTTFAPVHRLCQNVRGKKPEPITARHLLTHHWLSMTLSMVPHTDRWRKTAFIPTPAPYFHTLYSDCQGDFKVRLARCLFICEKVQVHPHRNPPLWTISTYIGV